MNFNYKNRIFYFISSYGGAISYINESYYEIIKNALNDLGIKSKNFILGTNIREVEIKKIINSVIVLMMPPDICLGFCEKHSVWLKKNNNIIISWCLEALGDFKRTEDTKKIRSNFRTKALAKMLTTGMIDFSWVHEKHNLDMLKEEKNFYLPIGYHACLVPNESVIKKDKRSVCFFGTETDFRRNIFDKIKNIDPNINICSFGLKTFNDFASRKNEIKDFLVAIDYPSTSCFSDFIGLHRVVSLVAAKIVVFSYIKLDEIGFVEGEDYIKFDNEYGFCKKLNKLSREQLYRISQNAFKKIKKNFIMSDMFNKLFLKMEKLKNK